MAGFEEASLLKPHSWVRLEGLADQARLSAGANITSLVSRVVQLGQQSWLSVIFFQKILKINFKSESLGTERAGAWWLPAG